MLERTADLLGRLVPKVIVRQGIGVKSCSGAPVSHARAGTQSIAGARMENYCMMIHVPVYVDGNRTLVASEWKRALVLLRDSLNDVITRFTLVAPSLSAADSAIELSPLSSADGFEVRPSIPLNINKREYFLRARAVWRRDVAVALERCDFAHTGISDLYKPIGSDAIETARRKRVPSALFIDTDVIEQHRDMIQSGLIRGGLKQTIYDRLYERHVRRVVSRSAVSFLKGQSLWNRYASYAANPRLFHDTSYRSSEVVSDTAVENRLARREDGTLRLVYCGRLVARKGCKQSIEIVDHARRAGARVTFDLIGDGAERAELEADVRRRGLESVVRFLGARPYNAELIGALSEYDALLFTPAAEDTPRMIFDAYAAGLPVIGRDILYVRERAAEEEATELLPGDRVEDAARIVGELARNGGRIARLTRNALKAGHENAADVWYRRRAEWTVEAYEASKSRA